MVTRSPLLLHTDGLQLPANELGFRHSLALPPEGVGRIPPTSSFALRVWTCRVSSDPAWTLGLALALSVASIYLRRSARGSWVSGRVCCGRAQ